MPSPSHAPGECFAKCKHVPWYMMSDGGNTPKSAREHQSCKLAHALGCKTDGGKKTGYIDFCKGPGCKTNKWRTCTCPPGKDGWGRDYLRKDGSCSNWKVQ